jgi:hypothetical protein
VERDGELHVKRGGRRQLDNEVHVVGRSLGGSGWIRNEQPAHRAADKHDALIESAEASSDRRRGASTLTTADSSAP